MRQDVANSVVNAVSDRSRQKHGRYRIWIDFDRSDRTLISLQSQSHIDCELATCSRRIELNRTNDPASHLSIDITCHHLSGPISIVSIYLSIFLSDTRTHSLYIARDQCCLVTELASMVMQHDISTALEAYNCDIL